MPANSGQTDTSMCSEHRQSLKAIIFDFDGVILESVDIKTHAFRELFKDYPQFIDKIVRLHLENGGMSRFGKFQIIYHDYLDLSLGQDELERLGRKFSHLVYRRILDCPYVPGARQFLQARAKQYSLFVASGTPQKELLDIVRQRGLDEFFDGVYGSPRSKNEILRMILAENCLPAGQAVFLGDALGDCLSARDVCMPFIGRVAKGNPVSFPGDSVMGVVENLKQLDQQWDSLVMQFSE